MPVGNPDGTWKYPSSKDVLRPCLEAKKFEYSNRVAYVLKCTVHRPVVFYLWRQRAKCRVAHLHTLPPANIAYLVSSREQEAQ